MIKTIGKKKRNKPFLPPNLRYIIYTFVDFKKKLMMIYLSKQDYKLLGEWKLYEHNTFLDKKKNNMLGNPNYSNPDSNDQDQSTSASSKSILDKK